MINIINQKFAGVGKMVVDLITMVKKFKDNYGNNDETKIWDDLLRRYEGEQQGVEKGEGKEVESDFKTVDRAERAEGIDESNQAEECVVRAEADSEKTKKETFEEERRRTIELMMDVPTFNLNITQEMQKEVVNEECADKTDDIAEKGEGIYEVTPSFAAILDDCVDKAVANSESRKKERSEERWQKIALMMDAPTFDLNITQEMQKAVVNEESADKEVVNEEEKKTDSSIVDKGKKVAGDVTEDVKRPSRKVTLPDILRSPFAQKKVSLRTKTQKTEDNIACAIFAAYKPEW